LHVILHLSLMPPTFSRHLYSVRYSSSPKIPQLPSSLLISSSASCSNVHGGVSVGLAVGSDVVGPDVGLGVGEEVLQVRHDAGQFNLVCASSQRSIRKVSLALSCSHTAA
jgi:hypothetical protein